MELHNKSRLVSRASWIVPGIAIVALCAGSGVASANAILTPHIGWTFHPGDRDSGGNGNNYQGNGDGPLDSDVVSTPDIIVINNSPPCDPVPEPGTPALVLAGLAGLLLALRRRPSRDASATAP